MSVCVCVCVCVCVVTGKLQVRLVVVIPGTLGVCVCSGKQGADLSLFTLALFVLYIRELKPEKQQPQASVIRSG